MTCPIIHGGLAPIKGGEWALDVAGSVWEELGWTIPLVGIAKGVERKAGLEELILPFKKLCTLKPSSVLMSHARTLAVDSGKSACFSEYWISQRLRRDFCFEGIIFSDDIFSLAPVLAVPTVGRA